VIDIFEADGDVVDEGDVVGKRGVIDEEEVGLDDEDIVGTEDELDANEEAENMNFEEGFRKFEVQEGENVDFKRRVSERHSPPF
jgi:hypothetical protein